MVEQQVEVYRPLPKELTDPLPYPEPLPQRFTESQVWNLVFDLYELVDLANEDRARAARVASGAE